MCRSIKNLHNFEPPSTPEEIESAALQFVRKISGMRAPSKENAEAFANAITQITQASEQLLGTLVSRSEPKNREEERLKAKAKWNKRNATSA